MSDITFVSPRYGSGVVGGAESAVRALATRLAADGYDIAVLSSRARSYETWADHYPEGTTTEEGVAVSRFSVDNPRPLDFDAMSARVLTRASEVGTGEGLAWIDHQGPTSAALIEAVAGVNSGVMAFTPYLYHPTVRGLPAARVPTILHAAAHPEAPLELPLFNEVFSAATGIAHYSRAEQDLVLSRFPATVATPQCVVGLPVEPPPFAIDPQQARESFGLGDEPFVVCLGRASRGKGANDLAAMFSAARSRGGSARLVFVGPVVDELPKSEGVMCVGSVSEEHKFGLLAAADVLINPSPLESFSLVVLEAWLAGTPVLVNGWCDPTRDHCEQSGGGLCYRDFAEFEVALNRLLDDADLRHRLADAGKRYVSDSYSWPAVRRRYLRLLSQISWRGLPKRGSAPRIAGRTA